MAYAITPQKDGGVNRTGIPGLDICKKHPSEPISYYCGTCEVPSCPQCLADDHPEPEHCHNDLDTAVQERLDNIQSLANECQEVKTKVETNLSNGEVILSDLESAIQEVVSRLDTAEENARLDFEKKLKECREGTMKKLQQLKEQRTQAVTANMEGLKKEHGRLGNAIRVASQVTNSASKHEVALTYSTLAGKMQKLRDIKPVTISKNHARVGFKPHNSCLDMLTSETLGNVVTRPGIKGKGSKVSFSDDTKPPAFEFDADSLARHGITSNVLKNAQNHNIMVADEKRSTDSTLELACEFGREGEGKVQHARGVAVSPTSNDIAIADYDTRQLKVYSSKGDFRFTVDTKQGNKWDSDSKPWDVAVSSEGEYLVTDKTPYVKVYDADGRSKGRFPAFSPDYQRSDVDDVGLYCIATDGKGRVLAGAGNFYVSIHSAARDGCHIASISVRLPPGFMATTSQGHIIIGSWSQQKVMIIDQAGEVLHTLKPPTGMTSWRPRGVSCSHDDEIYVANQVVGKGSGKSGLHRYQVVTGEHMGCITNDVKAPLGIAVLPDKGVVIAEKAVVKIFQWK